MNLLVKFLMVTFVATSTSIQHASAAEIVEGVFYNSVTGDYLVRYGTGDGSFEETTFYMSNKVRPVVGSTLSIMEGGHVKYSYAVGNSLDAKQSIVSIQFVDALGVDPSSMDSTVGWLANAVHEDAGDTISWIGEPIQIVADPDYGIRPGAKDESFSFSSTDLPGLSELRVRGLGHVTSFPDEGPDPDSEVARQLDALRKNDFVKVVVAVPRIRVGADTGIAGILRGMKRQIDVDLVEMRMIERSMVEILDPLMDAAIGRAVQGDMKQLVVDLRDVHRALQRAYPDLSGDGGIGDAKPNRLISRAAAEMLAFNVKYVEKMAKQAKK